ncbi:MAG: DNA alkylation repair protein [Candidatus Palauibacterales bacterium]|nr:DNA alkylation repair protein [Candidatus Palauibacterales bacterium]MDP2483332.1 DNA alkylation repair protein [Candidatus Palauibacterales bacterium]
MTGGAVVGWHAELRAEIRRLADPEYREGSLMVAPTAQRVYGIRTPENRRLANKWNRAHRDAAPREVLALVESLWKAESRDERMLGLEILRLRPHVVCDLDRERFDRWRKDIDNWGVCDFLGGAVLGPWAEADPAGRLSYLEDLIGDPHLYSRRLGLVAGVHLNRDGAAFGAWTLRQVDRLIDERDPMITKAVSWVLRQMTRHQAPEVAAYLESRGDRLAALPRREVRNKLETGRKNGRAG